jgi:hypothetical protein
MGGEELPKLMQAADYPIMKIIKKNLLDELL